jgi:hypothetical protein
MTTDDTVAERRAAVEERVRNWERHRFVLACIYVVIVAIPLIGYIRLPVVVGPETLKVFNAMEALEAGDVVVMDFSRAIADYTEINAWYMVLQCRLKGVKLIVMELCSGGGEGTIYWTTVGLPEAGYDPPGPDNPAYGVDYIEIGPVGGGYATLKKFLADIHDTCVTDTYGTPLGDIPMMDNIRSMADIDFYIELSSSQHPYAAEVSLAGYPERYIGVGKQGQMADDTALTQAGLMYGFIDGSMAAEYEQLMGEQYGIYGAATFNFAGLGLLAVFNCIGLTVYGIVAPLLERRGVKLPAWLQRA